MDDNDNNDPIAVTVKCLNGDLLQVELAHHTTRAIVLEYKVYETCPDVEFGCARFLREGEEEFLDARAGLVNGELLHLFVLPDNVRASVFRDPAVFLRENDVMCELPCFSITYYDCSDDVILHTSVLVRNDMRLNTPWALHETFTYSYGYVPSHGASAEMIHPTFETTWHATVTDCLLSSHRLGPRNPALLARVEQDITDMWVTVR